MANSKKYTRKIKKLTRKMKQKKYSMKKGGFWPFDKTNPDGTKSSIFDSFFKTKTDTEVIQDLKQQQQKCVDDIQKKIDVIVEKQQSSTEPSTEPMPEPIPEPMPETISEPRPEPRLEPSPETISEPRPESRLEPSREAEKKTMGGRKRRKTTYKKK